MKLSASAFIAIACAAPAFAQSGPYAKFYGGLVSTHDRDFVYVNSTVGPFARFEGELDNDEGFVVGAAVGYQLPHNVRIEGEVSYREVDSTAFASTGSTVVISDPETWSVMANAYYDFDLNSAFTPFVGLGVGAAATSGILDGAEDTGLAYQAIVGTHFHINEKQKIGFEYRYFETDEYGFERSITAGTITLDVDYRTSNFMATWSRSF